MLTAAGCDTLVVAGASMSGCVRAMVVDGLQHGLAVLVPREAVADRARVCTTPSCWTSTPSTAT
jgi:maleamate amidohydrolase